MMDFEVQDSEKTSDIPSPQNSDEREWTLMLTLETIKTGELTIPSLDVHYALNAKEAFKTLHTAPIQIHITSVLEDRADPKQFRDIKPTVDVPVPPSPSLAWITWTAVGTGALAVAVLLTVVVVRRRRRGPTPADWALAAIEDLEQLGATGTNDGAVVFNDVVDIVREYFELEFNVPTLPRTTREFLAEASEEIALPQQTSQRLKWMASVADEIKFARLSVSDQHVQQAFAQAKAFIAECELYRQATIKGAA